MNRKHKIELVAARTIFAAVAVIASASVLGGCAQVENQFGGKVLGASVTLAGVTLALSGTIPTSAPAAADPAK